MQVSSNERIHPKYHRPVKILLVDDSFLDLTILSAMLSEQGYMVQRTSSAAAALRIAETLQPELVMLDINMPEMNGYELCRRLKDHPKTIDIPIVFVSASDDGIDKQKAFNAGGADYIEKPFQPEEVDVRIQNQLKIRWSAQALQAKNQDLESTLKQLKETQSRIVEAERVAILSQVVGNIAQEIRQPMSFVESNLCHIHRCCDNMLSLLHLYEELCKRPEFLLSEAQRNSQLQLIQSDILDITQLLSITTTEAGQVSAVASSINNLFSMGEADLKQVDINKTVEVVLSVLRRRFQETQVPTIRQVQRLELLPHVSCYPNQLSQALFVMLSHALDAVDEKIRSHAHQDYAPTVEIVTQPQRPDRIAIAIRHNGIQPPELTYLKTESPQWTLWQNEPGDWELNGCKRELSLFMSYQVVVEKHHGSFDYRIADNDMTEFRIELPVLQPTG
ncbi:MAG: response regulator [Cyanobacteria bacterium P01_D01_bin.14]